MVGFQLLIPLSCHHHQKLVISNKGIARFLHTKITGYGTGQYRICKWRYEMYVELSNLAAGCQICLKRHEPYNNKLRRIVTVNYVHFFF